MRRQGPARPPRGPPGAAPPLPRRPWALSGPGSAAPPPAFVRPQPPSLSRSHAGQRLKPPGREARQGREGRARRDGASGSAERGHPEAEPAAGLRADPAGGQRHLRRCLQGEKRAVLFCFVFLALPGCPPRLPQPGWCWRLGAVRAAGAAFPPGCWGRQRGYRLALPVPRLKHPIKRVRVYPRG